MAKTIWRGRRGAPVRSSKTTTPRGKMGPAASTPEEFERRIDNAPITDAWLVDTRLKSERSKIDLCRIRPDRIRELTLQQLERAQFFSGPITTKERASKTNPRGLFRNFVSALIGERTQEDLSERSRAAYVKNYGEEPKPTEDIRRMYRREADQIEKQIYDMQQKKGCKIAQSDIAARDYARQTESPDQAEMARIRGKRRAKIR